MAVRVLVQAMLLTIVYFSVQLAAAEVGGMEVMMCADVHIYISTACTPWISTVCTHSLYALVILNLHDVYATDGSVAEFQCMGYAASNVFGFKIDNEPFHNGQEEELPKNVTYQSSQSGGTGNVKIATLNITIPAVIANNLTVVTCYFHDYDLAYYDTTATLYVTASKL